MTWLPGALVLGAALLWGRREPWFWRSGDVGAFLRSLREGVTRLWHWVPAPRRDPGWVADFADVVAVGLDSGLATVEAVTLAAEIGDPDPLVAEAARTSRETGRGLGSILTGLAPEAGPGRAELTFLARAWSISETVGAPAAPAARLAARTLRTRERRQAHAAALVAGPRASMWLLTLLPLLGPLAVFLVGAGVSDVYGSLSAAVLVVIGLALTGLGWWWSRTLLSRAARPAQVSVPGEKPQRGEAASFATVEDAADALVLCAVALRAGVAPVEALEKVSDQTPGAVGHAFSVVAAAQRWGQPPEEAWGHVGELWQPAAIAWTAAHRAGAAPAGLLDSAAERLRDQEAVRRETAIQRCGVLLVLPLGLCFLPGFLCTTVVPVVLHLGGQLLG